MGHALGNNFGKYYGFQSKPVWLDAKWTVDSTTGTGTASVKGQGIQNVFMHAGSPSSINPNPASGYALVQLAYNYTRCYMGPWMAQPPVTGGGLAIDGSALTAGLPYQIVTVGHAAAGAVTIAPVADTAGSLASTWFSLYDAYGNTFIIWFSVSGVGSAPSLGPAALTGTMGLHYIQQSIVTGDTASTIGTALAVTIAALPSGVSGVFSFTTAGTTTVTCTSTATNPYGPVAGPPSDGLVPTGFTFAQTVYTTNLADWQAVGVPKGVVPAVGVSFIATAAGYSTGGGSTGTVKLIGSSGICGVEVIGDPNLSLGPIPMSGSPNVGGWVLLRFMGPSFVAGAYTPLGTNSKPTFTVKTGTILANGTIGLDADSAAANVVGGTGITADRTLTTTSPVGTPTFSGTAASLTGTVSFVATAPTAGTIFYMSFLLEQAARVGGNNE